MRAAQIIALLLPLFTNYVSADMTIRYDAISPQHKKPVSTVLIKHNLVRINNVASNQPDVMVDLASGDLVQLHHESKSYFKINAQTVNQYVSLYRQNKDLMQALISQGSKYLGSEKRNQIQHMIDQYDQKSALPSSISFKNTGNSDQVLGVQCKIFTLIDQGRRTTDVCLAPYQQLKLSPEDVQSFEQLKKLTQQFKQSSPQQQDLLTIMANGLENLNGVPMKVVYYDPNGKIKNIIQAGSISLRPVAKLTYQIPQGFQQKLTPLL